MQEDIFARVEGVESDLEGHSGQQYALEHAVRRCHQPGGQVSVHVALQLLSTVTERPQHEGVHQIGHGGRMYNRFTGFQLVSTP